MNLDFQLGTSDLLQYNNFGWKHKKREYVSAVDAINALENYKRDAYKPILAEGNAGLFESKYGGSAYLEADEAWPSCGCENPMEFVMQINLDDLYDQTGINYGQGLFQMWKCFDDCDYSKDFTYRRIIIPSHRGYAGVPPNPDEYLSTMAADGVTTLTDNIRPHKIIGWKRVDDYPDYVEDIWKDIFGDKIPDDDYDYPISGDKLGGWSKWYSYPEYNHCEKCNAKMDTLFYQFGESDHHDWDIGGNGGVCHLNTCPNHFETNFTYNI